MQGVLWNRLDKFSWCHTDQKLHIKAAISSSYCIQTSSQSVLTMTNEHLVSGRAATRVPSFKSWMHSHACQYQQLHATICGTALEAIKQGMNRNIQWRSHNQQHINILQHYISKLSNIAKQAQTMILPRKHFSFQFKYNIYTFHSLTAGTLAYSHN